jgi:hypothetical protein
MRSGGAPLPRQHRGPGLAGLLRRRDRPRGALVTPGHGRPTDRALRQQLLQRVNVGRLRQVDIETGRARLLLVLQSPVSGKRHQESLPTLRHLPQAAGHLVAIHAWQTDIYHEH